MNINFHVYHYGSDNDETIKDILKIVLDNQLQIKSILKNQTIMNEELVKLETEVGELTTVVDSAIALIEGISQQIKDAGIDKAKLTELTNSLDSQANKLAAKVAENTEAEGEKPAE